MVLFFRFAVLAAVVCLLATGCEPSIEEPPPVTLTPTSDNPLGACARLTSIGVVLAEEHGGSAQRQGIELATELLNLRGSFGYRALFEEDGSDPEIARRAVQSFVEDEGVSALLVGSPTVIDLAGAPEVDGVPLISLFAGDEGVTSSGQNVFSVTLNQDALDAAVLSAIEETPGLSKSEAAQVSAVPWVLESPEGANLSFVKQYQTKFEAQPDLFAAHGYLSVFLVAAAVEDACSNDPSDVLAGITNLGETASPMGRFSFTKDREAKHPVTIQGLPE